MFISISFYAAFILMGYDPEVWGPHYWFFLHTLSLVYPKHPNDGTKKKFYDLIQNFHLFIPVEDHASYFSKLVTNYPVSPYLDKRDSFVRWVHFIHNKVNEKLEKPKVSYSDFYIQYYEAYKPKQAKHDEYAKWKERGIYVLFVIAILCVIYYLYDK